VAYQNMNIPVYILFFFLRLKSELAAMEEQNTGLKALWNETRTEKKKAVDKLLKVKKMRSLLNDLFVSFFFFFSKIEKITKQKLEENNLQWEEQLQEMERSYQGQVCFCFFKYSFFASRDKTRQKYII
jgi:hypothetical protein